MFIAINPAKIDARIGLRDVVEEGTLLDAITAPDAGDDENVHAASEGGDEAALFFGEADLILDVGPGGGLFWIGGEVVGVDDAGGVLPGEVLRVHGRLRWRFGGGRGVSGRG